MEKTTIQRSLVIFLFALVLFIPRPVLAQTPAETQGKVIIYFFWGDGCPHCAAAEPFLQELVKNNPNVELRSFEVWYNKENSQAMQTMAEKFGFKATGVPTIFIGNRYWSGFSDVIAEEIEATVKEYLATGAPDAGTDVVLPEAVITSGHLIDVPFIGKIDLDSTSLVVSTLLISFVDGVNPCSVWVLTMLLTLTLHAGSRKKVVWIGLVFLTVTALIYALFIAGLFTIFTVVSFMGWFQVLVAAAALFFGLINMKDYFWYKEGVSFTIADDKKPGIFSQMRKVMDAGKSFWGLTAATIVLAAGVSLVEFSCTAGFPVLWTNLLSAQKVDTLTFVLLLILYMVIYQLDELVIFFVAVFTLRASRLEEKQGRMLKLIGGVLMVTLAGVMIIHPAWMNNLGDSMLVFLFAAGLTGLILLLHRKILPAMGIWIGSEKKTNRRHR